MNLEQIAQTALNRDSLKLREQVLALLATYPKLAVIPEPMLGAKRSATV